MFASSESPQPAKVLSRAIVLLNLDGHIVSANGLAIKALGVEEATFLGKPLGDLLDKPTAPRLKQYFDRALKGSAVRCQARLKATGAKPAVMLNVRIRLHVMVADCALEATWDVQEPGRVAPVRDAQADAAAR